MSKLTKKLLLYPNIYIRNIYYNHEDSLILDFTVKELTLINIDYHIWMLH